MAAANLQCPKCEKTFSGPTGARFLGLHKRSAHGIVSPVYEQQRRYRENLKRKKTELAGGPYFCERCEKPFKTRLEKVKHYNREHRADRSANARANARPAKTKSGKLDMRTKAARALREPYKRGPYNKIDKNHQSEEITNDTQLQIIIAGCFGSISKEIQTTAQSAGLPYGPIASGVAQLLHKAGHRM